VRGGTLRSRAEAQPQVVDNAPPPDQGAYASSSPFGPPRQMDGVEQALAAVSHEVRLASAAALVAGGVCLGYLAGGRAGPDVRAVARLAGGAAVGGATAAAVVKLKEKTYSAAAAELHNVCASAGDPALLNPGDVQAIAPKYGIDNLSEKLEAEMKGLYDAYLSSVLPSSEEPLRGDEPIKIKAFKDALGIDDALAAGCHIDLGNRYKRQRLESGSREDGLQELRAFQKLVFVSEQVFGEKKSKFLLPWKRVFNLTDAQLNLAKRDNAKGLYAARLKGFEEASLNESFLAELKDLQTNLGLPDDVAADCLKTKCRAVVEGMLDKAVDMLNQRVRARDLSVVVAHLEQIVGFSAKVLSLSETPGLAPGLGQVSLYGGKYAAESQRGLMKELYKVFLEEKLAETGEISPTTVSAMDSLKLVFGMGNKEAASVKHGVTSKAYRKFLAAAYRDGTLESQESQAGWLQGLCEKIDFDPEEAMTMNLEQYRLKLDSILDKTGEISDADEEELRKIQKLLCIQASQISDINKEVKGAAFNATLRDVLTITADAFGSSEIMRLRKSINSLRLDKELAMTLASKRARQELMAMVKRVRNMRNQVESAQELKKLVFYSNFVLTPLVEEIDPSIAEENKKRQEEAEVMALMSKAQEEAKAQEKKEQEQEAAAAKTDDNADDGELRWVGESADDAKEIVAESPASPSEAASTDADATAGAAEEDGPSTLKKAKKGFGAEATQANRGQKVITLAEDMELRDRQDLYRMYLLYCMQGEVRKLGMGSSIVLERDESEFARLIQLGDVLGLTDADTLQIHQSLAEQAFRNQAQQMVRGSSLTPDKEAQLKEIQTKLGLPDDIAQKVIKGLVDSQTVGNLQALHAQGLLTVAKLRELKSSGLDLDSVMKKEARETLFKKELEQMLSNGQGNFNREEVMESIPDELGLERKAAARFVESSVKGRMRLLFVQAISFLRQRNVEEMMTNINNVLACRQAIPSESVQWSEREELMDVYAYYYNSSKDAAKLACLKEVLDISDEEAANLESLVDSGKFVFEEKESDDMAIF